MSDKDKIRQEIERRKKENMYVDLPMSIGRYYEDRDILAFIDSLPEEIKDAEQAAARYERENRQSILSSVDIVNAFIDGARWQSDRVPVTEATATRPTAEERVAKVRADLERHGLDPFKDKSRRMMTVAMRQCVFLMLRREGYTQRELGDAAGLAHTRPGGSEAAPVGRVRDGETKTMAIRWKR